MTAPQLLAITMLLAVACGGPSAPPPRAATTQRARPNAARSVAVARQPSADALSDWAACDIGVLDLELWVAVPRGAAITRDPDVCIATPRRGAQLEDAEWFIVLGGVSDDDGRSTALGIEPDGARRFLVDEAELDDAVDTTTGELELLGARARYFGLRATPRETGASQFVATRVRMRGGWLVGIAATRGRAPHLETLTRMLALARRR